MRSIRDGNVALEFYKKNIVDLIEKFGHPSDCLALAVVNPYLFSGKSLMDVGCGSGFRFAKGVLERGVQYYGIDSDWDEIYFKSKRLPEVADNLAVRSAQNLGDHGEKYNLVFAKSVMYHIPTEDVVDVLRKIYQAATEAVILVDVQNNSYCPDQPDLFSDFHKVGREIFISQGSDPDFNDNFESILQSALPGVEYEYFDAPRRPAGDYSSEVFDNALYAAQWLDERYKGSRYNELSGYVWEMIRYLRGENVNFVPYCHKITHIPKV